MPGGAGGTPRLLRMPALAPLRPPPRPDGTVYQAHPTAATAALAQVPLDERFDGLVPPDRRWTPKQALDTVLARLQGQDGHPPPQPPPVRVLRSCPAVANGGGPQPHVSFRAHTHLAPPPCLAPDLPRSANTLAHLSPRRARGGARAAPADASPPGGMQHDQLAWHAAGGKLKNALAPAPAAGCLLLPSPPCLRR